MAMTTHCAYRRRCTPFSSWLGCHVGAGSGASAAGRVEIEGENRDACSLVSTSQSQDVVGLPDLSGARLQ